MGALEKHYRILLQKQTLINKELDELKRSAKGRCKHLIYRNVIYSTDNGYGQWHNVTYKKCEICGEVTQPYQNKDVWGEEYFGD